MSDQPPRPNQPAPCVVARPVWYPQAALAPPGLPIPGVCRRDALLALAVVLLATIVLPYVPALLIPIAPRGAETPLIGTEFILRKWSEMGLAAGLLALFMLRHRLRPGTFGLRGDRIGGQMLWGLAGLVGIYATLLAMLTIMLPLYLLSPNVERELQQRVEFVEALPVDNLGVSIMLLIAVAVHEELVFRGLLLPYLRRLLGSWWLAGAVSALIFALLHVPDQGPLGGIMIFAIAVVLTVFFVKTRSLLAVIVAHFLFDLLQFQLARLLPRLQDLLEATKDAA